ncbi:hypothetical protein CGLO_18272 [Colletotrichum gloeosporioides Cg-14]|uniref:Uncharacterized protein n=1 Tax=Colletotrichum gloeosporioides (strain Cg-14) TaxID=1237896 RepID=T0KV09_COLGC|nr:hypothetical protein CGLO_18272 [Colletotrichum gloeosporioides Cg-14]
MTSAPSSAAKYAIFSPMPPDAPFAL